jgi:hypothetical protein
MDDDSITSPHTLYVNIQTETSARDISFKKFPTHFLLETHPKSAHTMCPFHNSIIEGTLQEPFVCAQT